MKSTKFFFMVLMLISSFYGIAQGMPDTPKNKNLHRNQAMQSNSECNFRETPVNGVKSFQVQQKQIKNNWWEPETLITYNFWEEPMREWYEYAGNGLMSTHVIQKFISEQWVNENSFHYTYNEQDNLLTWFIQKWENGQWRNDAITYYTYDSQSHLLLHSIQSIWSDNEWFETVQMVYTYDERGNQLSHTCIVDDNDGAGWINLYRYSYTFDERNNLLTKIDAWWEGSEWVPSNKSIFTYDNNNNKLTSTYETWRAGTMFSGGRDTYTYDDQNNEITNLNERYSAGSWKNVKRGVYTYDDRHNRLSETTENWKNEAWINTIRVTYTFDDNNNNTKMLREDWRNNAWENIMLYTDDYDSNNNLLMELAERWENDTWVTEERVSMTYDGNNNRLTWVVDIWEDNDWSLFIKYTWTFDENSNMLSDLYESWVEGPLTSWKYTFSYDDYGNCILGEFLLWENEAWVEVDAQGWTWVITYNNTENRLVADQLYALTGSFHKMTGTYKQVTQCLPPKNLHIDNVIKNQCLAMLNWEVDDETALYNIYRNDELIASDVAGNTYLDDNPFTAGQEYEWCVATICGDTESRKICQKGNCSSSINDPVNEAILLYPNPATSTLFINGENITQVEIYNTLGQMIESKKGNISSIGTSTYQQGIYFVKIFFSENHVITKRVMIVH